MTGLYEEIREQPAGDVPVRRISITVNGEARTADVEPRLLLAHLLRQGFKLTGTHTGCDTTNCGACTVLYDGQPIKSCTMLAVQADGHDVTTVEGLAGPSELHPIQEGAKDEIKIGGLGASRKRVEDNRFIRGKGRYVDDIVLPGMLHMEILRSPFAHARIVSIDTSKAWNIPGVRLVLTGVMMAQRNLAWMPTLSYDTQAVLATDKVRFQGQEVAAVIADDPYIAKDACEAIVVEYEALPAIVNPTQAMADGAPVIRDDKENQVGNVVFDWQVGDKDATDRAFAQADVVSRIS